MVKTNYHHHPSISGEISHQQQDDYYINMLTNQTSIPTSSLNEITISDHKEIYPWMMDKKYGNNKKISHSGKI